MKSILDRINNANSLSTLAKLKTLANKAAKDKASPKTINKHRKAIARKQAQLQTV